MGVTLISSLSLDLRRGNAGKSRPILPFPELNYCNNFSTSCCCWLAWASAEMPVCSRMEYLVRLATADGISAAVIVFSADVKFCTWLLMTLLAAVSRFTLAPNVPRVLATLEMAALIKVNAVCASV